MQMSIPQAKIDETLILLRTWEKKTTASRQQLQQLLGKLFHIAKCVKPARLFVGRMLDTLRRSPLSGFTPLDDEFQKDIFWFLQWIALYNGVHLMKHIDYYTKAFVDSSLTGCGGICGHQIYHAEFPDFILDMDLDIVHLEMLNIVLACKLWANVWSNAAVEIFCDNAPAVCVLQNGRSKDNYLLKCAREIWLICVTNDISLKVTHKPGHEMDIPDALSRFHSRAASAVIVNDLIKSGNYISLDVDPYQFILCTNI
jgi:hypothetical protein